MASSGYQVPEPPRAPRAPEPPKVAKVKKPTRADVPGVKTSEFWLTLGVVMFPVLDGILGWGLPTEKIIAAVAAVGVYAASRAVAKRPPKLVVPVVEVIEEPKK